MNHMILSTAAAFAMLIGSVASASAVSFSPARPHVQSTLEQVQYWRGEHRRGCRAVGLTINGRQIPGVEGRGFGRDSCAEAMSECRHELRQRQRQGYNPYGRCTIVR